MIAGFDLQGHRGARGLRPENTLAAFAFALELGVSTLELDVGVTADGVVVVTHDRLVSPLKCRDTAAAFPGDAGFPYLGRPIRQLTLAQLKTLDLSRRHPLAAEDDPFIATQRPTPGSRMATLAEVFELVQRYGATGVRFNIETKIDPRHPVETLPPEPFTRRVLAVVESYGMASRTTLQSFDWRSLLVARRESAEMERAALVAPGTVHPLWLAGLEPEDFDGDVAAAAAAIDATVLSPEHHLLDAAMLASARWRGLAVLPWTVNDPARMRRLIHLGVDGMITDYPDRLRWVLDALGRQPPEPCVAPQPTEVPAITATS